MNTHRVTIMVERTWWTMLPRLSVPGAAAPQKLKVNLLKLNAMTAISTKATKGTSLATVVIMLTKAAWRTPFSTTKCRPHSAADAPITDSRLLPLPNTGKKKAREPKIATAYETLPSQALTQYPQADWKPM